MRALLGVTGGVAAYKAVEVLRALQVQGVEVEVAMTRAAQRFITPLTFAALTGRPVHSSLWRPAEEPTPQQPIDHIALAQRIDALLIAPATANTISSLAQGRANDLLGAVYLATRAPVVVAPAMNVLMWQHAATQANVALLRGRGVHIVEPESGFLACGMTGAGRLASAEAIVERTLLTMRTVRDLQGETILITAGGTREAIDPVRYLGNRSSGKMGHALAEAAIARGARVILVTASSLPAPQGAELHRVDSAAAMEQVLLAELAAASVVVAAAAVADFRPIRPSTTKIRRSGPLYLELEPTPDLVAQAAQKSRDGTLVIAFAAETENLETNARAKLLRKGVHAVVANDVTCPGTGFEADQNAGLFITSELTQALPLSSKRQMADRIFDEVLRLRARGAGRPRPVVFA